MQKEYKRKKSSWKNERAAYNDVLESLSEEERNLDSRIKINHSDKYYRWEVLPAQETEVSKLETENRKAINNGEFPATLVAKNIEHDLRESISSDVKEISEAAKHAAKAIAEALADHAAGKLDSEAMRSVFESYWRVNRSKIARIGERTARRTLLGTLKAVLQLATGITGGTSSLAQLRIN